MYTNFCSQYNSLKGKYIGNTLKTLQLTNILNKPYKELVKIWKDKQIHRDLFDEEWLMGINLHSGKLGAKYIKDLSSETKDVETYLFVKEYISKYQLSIDINSRPLKNKLIEINTTLKFEDKSENEKKSYFEIIFATIVQTTEEIKEKNEMEKIILCDVQIEIYPDLEKALLNLLHNSGYPNIKFEKKVDFEKLYNERLN